MTAPAYQQMIFVNLPVNDLAASKKFFTELGYTINPQFSDENATSVVISDTIVAMLLTKPFYATFTKKEIADAAKTSEVLIALSAESRAKVDELVDRALARAAPRAATHRTWASCTAAPSTTSTATPGRSSGWTRRPSRAEAGRSPPSAAPGALARERPTASRITLVDRIEQAPAALKRLGG
ncbi:hypothetical protein JCM4814A_30720 [Streptomyces phaeofaciens JCM 4814]|uniref:Glyoxalase/Bleomycin resistance-like N-terminal domain-containing protein n=1 Tax=Streptomyces phaeofaciens TaxID=68254 RepID=A0A918HIR5_9ACTN|nr:hypothetical protein GCM10010226_51550 [Streptomyces phaeofaciens]